MKYVSDIYAKVLKLSPDNLVAAMRVFPSRDGDGDDEKMTWERRREWERVACELKELCRTLVLESRGLDLQALKDVEDQWKSLNHDLDIACKKSLHCGRSMHSGTEPEHVFPINIEWAAKGNVTKARLDKFRRAFEKDYGSLFKGPKYIDVDFGVLTQFTSEERVNMALSLRDFARDDGEIEHAEPVSEVTEALKELFP